MAQRAPGSTRRGESFSTVPPNSLQRSAFDLSHSHTTTIDSGLVYPLLGEELNPGDSIALRPAFFARMATPLKPYMSGIHLDWQVFFCPMRLLWDNFIRMMGERPTPSDHNDYTIPQMVAPAGGHLNGSIADYLGMPTEIAGYTHSALYHRMYNLCYREWFRDESIVDPPVVDLGDGPDDPLDYVLLRRLKRKDYFTGALPFAQKGDPVSLPLGISAPITGSITGDGINAPIFQSGASVNNQAPLSVVSANVQALHDATTDITGDLYWTDPALDASGLSADLSAASAATVNQLRQAISIQHLLERDARGGTRYREMVLAHFNTQTDDVRLLRPELLGTGHAMVQAEQIHQTAPAAIIGQTNLGDLAAIATGISVGRGITHQAKEHELIMVFASIRADLTYQQGLHRKFTRLTRYDHFHPDLAMLGEQPVESREIFTDGTGDPVALTGDYSIWGYQPRYEEYRHRTSFVSGEMRSNFAQSLDVWHLGLDFATRPVLNDAFLEENPPIERIAILNSGPEFLLDCHFKFRVVRNGMPRFGQPGLTRF